MSDNSYNVTAMIATNWLDEWQAVRVKVSRGSGASLETLARRLTYGGHKGRRARQRILRGEYTTRAQFDCWTRVPPASFARTIGALYAEGP